MTISRRLKYPLLLCALLSGLGGFRLAQISIRPENAPRKDVLQEYVGAEAILAGVNPYQPLPDLRKQFQMESRWSLPHPTPHTPFLLLLSLPFAFLPYTRAAGIWTFIEGLFLFASFYLLFRWFSASARPWLLALMAWAALGWGHAWEDLIWGQINAVLLLLLVGAWLALRRGREGVGGVLLGIAFSLKLIFWPLVLFLALCRKWVGAVTALAFFAAVNLAAALALGWRVVANYYLVIGPSTSAYYRAYAQNLSLWSIGWRVFSETWSPALTGVKAPPLFFSPRLALGVSLLLTGAALVLGMAASVAAARKGKIDFEGKIPGGDGPGEVSNFDLAYGGMICVCLLVSPQTWPHYLVLLALPLTVALRRLRELRFPKKLTPLCAGAILILLIPDVSLQNFIFSFSPLPESQTSLPGVQLDVPVSFAAGLLSLIPIVSVLILFWLTWRLARRQEETSSYFEQANL
jgi:hypothetical protein